MIIGEKLSIKGRSYLAEKSTFKLQEVICNVWAIAKKNKEIWDDSL